jgi:peptidoglycan/xylan/chitin deacetylase (PgdA/CDA1 family)
MLLPWRVPRVPILYYHEIGDTRARHIVHRDDFAAQIHWLIDAGFDVLSLDALLDVYAGRRSAPSRPVLVTFDDGRAGVLRHAAPLLERLRVPATVYVVTRWLEGREIPDGERYSGFVSTPDLPLLREAGIEIGSHTHTHRTLKRLDDDAIAEEVGGSRRWLEDTLGAPVAHFSFPKGRSSRAADRAVRRAGYRSAVRTGERWNGRWPNALCLWRCRVDGLAPLSDFRHRLSSHRAG